MTDRNISLILLLTFSSYKSRLKHSFFPSLFFFLTFHLNHFGVLIMLLFYLGAEERGNICVPFVLLYSHTCYDML